MLKEVETGGGAILCETLMGTHGIASGGKDFVAGCPAGHQYVDETAAYKACRTGDEDALALKTLPWESLGGCGDDTFLVCHHVSVGLVDEAGGADAQYKDMPGLM